MITVHHLNNSRSQRVLWLLEELNLHYQIQHYQRDPHTLLAPPELKEIHPLGKSPVISDGELTLAESGAIVEYLVDTYGSGRLKPASAAPEHSDYLFWLHHAEGSLMPPLVMSLVFSRLDQPPVPWLLRPLARKLADGVRRAYLKPQLDALLSHADRSLARSGWFAGPVFSAADIQMSFPLEAARARGLLNQEHPHALDFLQRIHARPAYQIALEKGGPYAYGAD
ncbi:glutathione S-transferase family protein [Chromobacterium haemolyticum]|uniref:glutathione S-transferase family protein n=1 Tax=Chromobacterium haemolyticum TaxID=394935 RepID=UPI0002F5D088|nr:glutathione S-transferase [Chromobacterium haemolyticum]OQS40489.1 glutathione S-transferase [Chromobacterium haemolyticum]PTU70287.1 glutathione S-transferase [Chromobacterium haemolyticum]